MGTYLNQAMWGEVDRDFSSDQALLPDWRDGWK